MKYIVTKRMTRTERAKLCSKIYKLMFDKNRGTLRELEILSKRVKAIKKKNLLKTNKEPLFAYSYKSYKGIKVFLFINGYDGYDIVFNTSPIDAGYLEFIRIKPNGDAVIYTQHLFDRYNERVYGRELTSYKEMVIEFFKYNQIKALLVLDKDNSGKCSQRIDDGFLMGMYNKDENITIFNTFYDSEEYKDNELKSTTRNQHKKLSDLSDKELDRYNELSKERAEGKISQEDYGNFMSQNGFL